MHGVCLDCSGLSSVLVLILISSLDMMLLRSLATSNAVNRLYMETAGRVVGNMNMKTARCHYYKHALPDQPSNQIQWRAQCDLLPSQ